jgi:hypothetical protein
MVDFVLGSRSQATSRRGASPTLQGLCVLLESRCCRRSRQGQAICDLEDAANFDFMGLVERPGLGPRYDLITPYLEDANLRLKDLEVVAVTLTFGYGTAYQHYWGKATDRNAFDFTYRRTSIMRERMGFRNMCTSTIPIPFHVLW